MCLGFTDEAAARQVARLISDFELFQLEAVRFKTADVLGLLTEQMMLGVLLSDSNR